MTNIPKRRRAAGGERSPSGRKPAPNAFSAKKRDAFFDALGANCNIRGACRTAGISSTTVYKWRRRDAGFRLVWEEAVRTGYARLELKMLARGINGRRQAIWYAGKKVGTEVVVSDKLGMMLLTRNRQMEAARDAAAAKAAEDAKDGEAGDNADPAEAIRIRIEAKIEAVARRLRIEDGQGGG